MKYVQFLSGVLNKERSFKQTALLVFSLFVFSLSFLYGCDVTHLPRKTDYRAKSDITLKDNIKILMKNFEQEMRLNEFNSTHTIYYIYIYPKNQKFDVFEEKLNYNFVRYVDKSNFKYRFDILRSEFVVRASCDSISFLEQYSEINETDGDKYYLFGNYDILEENIHICVNLFDANLEMPFLKYDFYFPIDQSMEVLLRSEGGVVPSVNTQ